MTPVHPLIRRPNRIRALALALALAALSGLGGALGCTGASSPTLPIPPPAALSSAPDAEGFVTIQGSSAIEGAMVSAYNERLEVGVIGVVDDLGTFELRLRADVGDSLALWQTVGAERGEILTIRVPSP